jgi:hypothetical protein
MRHIQNKDDWFYEFRPLLILCFGIIGLFGQLVIPNGSDSLPTRISQACGITLVLIAIKIMDWRRDYRAASQKMRSR